MSRADMIDARETRNTHAMTFQGVELGGNGRPVAWRIENSWGEDACKGGYLVASAEWFRTYGGEPLGQCAGRGNRPLERRRLRDGTAGIDLRASWAAPGPAPCSDSPCRAERGCGSASGTSRGRLSSLPFLARHAGPEDTPPHKSGIEQTTHSKVSIERDGLLIESFFRAHGPPPFSSTARLSIRGSSGQPLVAQFGYLSAPFAQFQICAPGTRKRESTAPDNTIGISGGTSQSLFLAITDAITANGSPLAHRRPTNPSIYFIFLCISTTDFLYKHKN